MKGVLICGGTGSRLKPLTDVTNKSLLPVYDRPLIEYPLGILLKAGIRDIVVISGTEHLDQMETYLKSRAEFDHCTFHFTLQKKAGGIAQALGLAEEFAAGDSVCALLGDNVYFDDLSPVISSFTKGGHVFLKTVDDPERFGVASLDTLPTPSGATRDDTLVKVVSIEEKPVKPKSNLAVTGCYLYDNRCFEIIRTMKPSARGELEITDVSRWYMEHGELTASLLQKDWVDAGTFESLYRATMLVRVQRGVAGGDA
jgi:glucose-1-phosphate thymidylyltransferase